jgi:cytoskeletal protein CcmA (bactofilin family)
MPAPGNTTSSATNTASDRSFSDICFKQNARNMTKACVDALIAAGDVSQEYVIARGAQINGSVAAERVVVSGNVEGPIHGGDVILKSEAHVVGDVHHRSLTVEGGAYFDGRSVQRKNGQLPEKSIKEGANPRESLSRRLERAESGNVD